ncbi:MAG: DUF177 domain-containing protein [Rhodothermales bacterium]|nr:DUF177 domain-containing protein [Rhodothermales bacterium]
MLRIDIASLRRGANEVIFEPSADELDLDSDEFSGIRVDADVDVRQDQVVVRFVATAEAHLICDRTLRPFTEAVKGTYAMLFSSRGETQVEGMDDVQSFSASEPVIDITEAVRDTLILAVPTKRLAPGADEIEIPSRFGGQADGEIDPRWEALRRLR